MYRSLARPHTYAFHVIQMFGNWWKARDRETMAMIQFHLTDHCIRNATDEARAKENSLISSVFHCKRFTFDIHMQ